MKLITTTLRDGTKQLINLDLVTLIRPAIATEGDEEFDGTWFNFLAGPPHWVRESYEDVCTLICMVSEEEKRQGGR